MVRPLFSGCQHIWCQVVHSAHLQGVIKDMLPATSAMVSICCFHVPPLAPSPSKAGKGNGGEEFCFSIAIGPIDSPLPHMIWCQIVESRSRPAFLKPIELRSCF